MYSKIKNITRIWGLAFIFSLVFVSAASAQVVVSPSSSLVSAWELYTVKVPVEKNNPTNKITLKIPPGEVFKQYEPVVGWTFSIEKDSSDKVTLITWTATGDGILPGQFQEFKFVAQNSKTAVKVAWDAYQYYKDGSVLEWTKNEGADTPHSATNIVAGHIMPDGSTMLNSMMSTQSKGQSGTDSNIPVAVWISIISIAIATIAMVLTLLGRRKL